VPTVAVIDGVKIQFYPDEHAPPHFHAVIAEFAAQIRIDSSAILRGSLPHSKLRPVLRWAAQHRDALGQAWLAVEEGRKPEKIR
jgi:hypothetical protein